MGGMAIVRSIEALGASLTGTVSEIGRIAMFAGETLKGCLRPPWRIRMILTHSIQLGVRAMPLAMVTALFVGMVIVLQTGYELTAFGVKQYVPGGAAKALTRAMIPIFTALVVGARTAASIAAELGTMRVTEQIDAMSVLDVAPRGYLVVPRVIATTLMVPIVTIYADAVGLVGGMLIGWLGLQISTELYWNVTFQYLTLSDVLTGILKTFFFGATMGICGCYFGFHAEGGAEGVGKATTRAAVFTMLSLILLEYLLSTWSIYILETLFTRDFTVGG
jgi:phospholipid/cholesterol/gamma-HCH transport system permease protein